MEVCGATIRDSRGRIQGACNRLAGHDGEHSTESLRPIPSFLFDGDDEEED